MDSDLKAIKEYPDIDFIEGYTITQLEQEMVKHFCEKYEELTGKAIVLAQADDRRILLQTGAYFLYQGYVYSDNAGKMGLLKYSTGDYLENLGALKHIYRKEATGATTTARFKMDSARSTTTGIPRGTRLTAGDGIYFATESYAEILPGGTYVDVPAHCMTVGSSGNNYAAGEISTIVDPVPFIDSASNITAPENGADMESDDSLRLRIHLAPAAYSSAGTEDAWKYFVRECNPSVTDILVANPEPRVVRVRYLLEGGEVPGAESLAEMREYLTRDDIKPLTDTVEVLAPETKPYSLSLTYYINRSSKSSALTIQASVEKAVQDYILWQGKKLGRDINPSELTKLILAAGAKRVEITEPVFTVTQECEVAIIDREEVIYGGLEDD